MFMDISSELIHSLLPIFMVSVLGSSMLTVGLVEGIAEAAAAITKVFSGALSDRLRRRKTLLVFGYALAACTKPVFPLAGSIGWIFAARFVDRIGKGIRGAPRDALVADLTLPAHRGAAYGLRQALDSVGALLGPLLAIACLAVFANDLRAAMWVGVLPALVAVVVLTTYVQEPQHLRNQAQSTRVPLRLAHLPDLPLRFWLIVLLGAVFTLARFSEAFLVLRAQDLGLALVAVPLVMVLMNLLYAVFAYPAGLAADHFKARSLLLAGLLMLIGADALLASAQALPAVFAGAALWGLHMALTQGLLAKLVADTAPETLRGTAFGLFNLVSGLALLLASVIAGALWQALGASASFVAGAGFAALAALGLLLYRPPIQSR